ncbi:MAG: type II toxin-antitoxin system RelE/ParE family toxin [Fibromonadales bacterium]|nr:type II toxin-antitoxin system RelE/ParE family toxin [Fibromonadales bacterium]
MPEIEKPARPTAKCLELLERAMEYIAKDSPQQAEILHRQFYEKISGIETMPGIGTPYKNGMRKTGLGKFRRYNIYYREKETEIEILGIWHTSKGAEFTES